MPEGFTLNVHEESPASAHIVLPPSPDLSTTQLTAAAGGLDLYQDSDNDDDYY